MFVPIIATIAALAVSARAEVTAEVQVSAASNDKCGPLLAPTQIRIAYAGEKAMAISWNTQAQLEKPTVYFGTSPRLEHYKSSHISTTYQSSTTYANHVVITDLDYDKLYYYSIKCDTKTLTFTTAREIGKGAPFTFAMIGDMGTFGPDGLSTTTGVGAKNPLKAGEHTTIESLVALKSQYDFVWHVGDIAYADSWVKEENQGYITPLNTSDHGAVYDRVLNEFYTQTEVLSKDKPYMVLPGNHEANCDNGSNLTICVPGQLNFTGYLQHWNMPAKASGGFSNMWYSWDHGMVHFISFNTETDFPGAPDEPGGSGAEFAGPFQPSGAQLAWLTKDLAKVDRKKTPWVIAAGHRPWYVSTSECKECQYAFEPILIKYGVDLVMHGHKHFYERHAAVDAYGNQQEITKSPTVPMYIVNGAAGHYDGLDNPTLPAVASSRKLIGGTYGWNLISVKNCTHLTSSFVVSGNNTILDTVTLYKNRVCKLN